MQDVPNPKNYKLKTAYMFMQYEFKIGFFRFILVMNRTGKSRINIIASTCIT